MAAADDLQAAECAMRRTIERAVQQAISGALTVDAAVNEALAAFATSTPAEVIREESSAMLAAYDSRGGGRSAAMLVARAFARDRQDPLELERIAQRVRRLARERKTNGVRFAG